MRPIRFLPIVCFIGRSCGNIVELSRRMLLMKEGVIEDGLVSALSRVV